MTTDVTLRRTVAGRTVAVHVAHADDRAAVDAVLRGFADSDPDAPADLLVTIARGANGLWTVGDGVTITHEAATLEHALLALEWRMVSDLLARNGDRFHLHGAALADPTQTCSVLVLGDSGVGKTTLTLALIARGFQPFADDVVLLEPETGIPERFPRAFHVDAATRALVAPLFGEAEWEETGLPEGYCLPRRWAATPLPVGAIILPKGYGHPVPLLMRQTTADAALAVLTHTSTLETAPALALRAAARLTAQAPTFALWSGDVATTVEMVHATIAGLAAPPASPLTGG